MPWLEATRDGVRLACLDFGGQGPAILFLHGLAGHSGEWAPMADALCAGFRVVGLDQRGHGRSERSPSDLSREAFVADVVAVVDQLSLAPVALVGQSMGGNTALLTAARHPDLVSSLVVVEASPDGPAPELPGRIEAWLDRWPTPFASLAEARAFFGTEGLAPGPWTDGLEPRADGWWPAFETGAMVRCIAGVAERDYWREWDAIECPTLLVRGEHGSFDAAHMEMAVTRLARGQAVTIRGAGHDAHLDAPALLAEEIRRFLQ